MIEVVVLAIYQPLRENLAKYTNGDNGFCSHIAEDDFGTKTGALTACAVNLAPLLLVSSCFDVGGLLYLSAKHV